MSVKDYAINVVNSMSDDKLLAFITLFADENTAARAESEMLAADPNSQRFNSVDELFEELLS